MSLQYYHNASCSKSRAALQLLQDAGVVVEQVLYLERAPEVDVVLQLAQKLGVSVHDMVRSNEAEYEHYADLPIDDDQQWAKAIHNHPKLLQRPILVGEVSALICRPPELALTWLAEQGHESA